MEWMNEGVAVGNPLSYCWSMHVNSRNAYQQGVDSASMFCDNPDWKRVVCVVFLFNKRICRIHSGSCRKSDTSFQKAVVDFFPICQSHFWEGHALSWIPVLIKFWILNQLSTICLYFPGNARELADSWAVVTARKRIKDKSPIKRIAGLKPQAWVDSLLFCLQSRLSMIVEGCLSDQKNKERNWISHLISHLLLPARAALQNIAILAESWLVSLSCSTSTWSSWLYRLVVNPKSRWCWSLFRTEWLTH